MWSLDQIDRYQHIIDVRSPAEYQIDHICGACNFPVLSNAERKEIGLLYKASSFDAKRRGAAMVSSRIAHYLEQHFQHHDSHWQPLIYCWRGGSRSAAFTHILRHIGWSAEQLPGGYKAYRGEVIRVLETSIPSFRFIVLCGATGVGKSDLLQTLAQAGEQVIDLEALAEHRGSALGQSLRRQQPSQKMFESRLVKQLRGFTKERVVYIESESRRVGNIYVPDSLVKAMRAARCWKIVASLEARVEYLQRSYQHFIRDPESLQQALKALIPFHGHTKVQHWITLAQQGNTAAMVADLLNTHYDPAYMRAMQKHFFHYPQAPSITMQRIDAQQLQTARRQLVKAMPLLSRP